MQKSKHDVNWDDDGVPVSRLFGDAFHSRGDGQAETAHVFLDGNGLPQRWSGDADFSIAELGFGTGLNFLETWRQWIATRSPGQRLVFTSFEAYPVSANDMRKALARWDALHDLAPMLVSRWDSANSPPAAWHMDGQTELRVIGGEAEDTVRQWSGLADAWYLDGFSPAKNQAMWSLDLMQHVFNHTMPHGTFATYTAAGWVRRNLLAAGFSVSKCKGFSGKREMLQGCKPG